MLDEEGEEEEEEDDMVGALIVESWPNGNGICDNPLRASDFAVMDPLEHNLGGIIMLDSHCRYREEMMWWSDTVLRRGSLVQNKR